MHFARNQFHLMQQSDFCFTRNHILVTTKTEEKNVDLISFYFLLSRQTFNKYVTAKKDSVAAIKLKA